MESLQQDGPWQLLTRPGLDETHLVDLALLFWCHPRLDGFLILLGMFFFFRVTIPVDLRAHWGLLVNTVVNGPWPGVWEGFLSQFVLISSSLTLASSVRSMVFPVFFFSRAVCRGRAGCQVREGWLGFWQCWFWCLRFRVDNSWVGSWEEIIFLPYEDFFKQT